MDKFDKIVYINLEHRKDRKESIENELQKMGINNYIQFNAIYYEKNGPKGCAESHIKVLKMAKQNRWKNILILEDDFIFTQSKKYTNNIINQFFNENIVWNILMFSGNLHKAKKYNEYLDYVLDAQTTSGYAVNQNFYDTLIDNFEMSYNGLNIPIYTKKVKLFNIDIGWKKLQPISKWFIFNPKLGKQKEGYSDILKKYKKYNC